MDASLLAVAAACGLVVATHPVSAQSTAQRSDQQPQGQPPANQPPSQQTQRSAAQTAPFTRINVTTAASIVGQPLLDTYGERLGEVEYMMINPVDGRIVYVVLGRGGMLDLGEARVPVPWGHITVTPGDSRSATRVALSPDAPSLNEAPRVSMSTLRQLTDPTFVTRVITFYGDASAGQGAGAGDAGGQGQAAQAQRDQSRSQGGSAASRQAQPTTPEGPDRQAGAQRHQQQQSAGQGNPMTPSQPGRPGDDSIIVGRAIVTTLGPPLVDWRSDIVGAQVVSRDGREIGEIDQLVVDTERGRVADAVVAQGGFLGFGETLKPVPLQALT